MLRAFLSFSRHLRHSRFRTSDQHRLQQITMSPQRQGIKRSPQAGQCLLKRRQQRRTTPREIRKGMQRVELATLLVPRPILPRILRVNEKAQAFTKLMQQRFGTRCIRHLRQVPHDLTIRRTCRPGACVEAR